MAEQQQINRREGEPDSRLLSDYYRNTFKRLYRDNVGLKEDLHDLICKISTGMRCVSLG